ncbi:MAG: SDR family oxidoreductase [Desulfobacterales bacterium]|nr:SDR family oxidoreductase [Desulfobacterales bacterium]
MPFQKNPNIDPVESAIAIIGMSCFFPKSSDLKEYWKLLFQGEDAISVVPDTHWSISDYFDADPKKPDHVYCKRGGFLPPVLFDPMEFGIPPAALEATDTSQLLALVAAKRALADAGYGDGRFFDRERTSVVLGVTGTQELVIPLSTRLGHPIWRRAMTAAGLTADKTDEIIQKISDSYVSWQENSFPGLLGNVVAGRISNRLDLGGTNCVVDAACASSMGAIHMAVMELMSGRIDMVITGGVDTLNDIFMHMCFSKTQVLSATGDARPFSKNADGTVLGEGIGMLILKRLPDAEKDGDRIYAVIRGIGSSSDGKSQSIYAPRADGQAKALRSAYRIAGIEPTSVELVEAHGTGTKVGDRVEFQALSQVFANTDKSGTRRALGSVKSMIGHTKAAAGAAGMIKIALSLYNKVLPPTLKVEAPDPSLNLAQSPFYLNTLSRPWLSHGSHPRRAGVSAFGFGGSNFHAVLEEYQPLKPEVSWDGSIDIFSLSAPTKSEIVEKLCALKTGIDAGLTDNELAVAAAASRNAFSAQAPHRLLVVFDRREERPEGLSKRFARTIEMLSDPKVPDRNPPLLNLPDVYYGAPGEKEGTAVGKIAFVFPGQGSQYVGMGRDLACLFPEAAGVLETANRKFTGPARLSDVIFPPPAFTDAEREAQEALLRRTDIAQPAIGAVNLAMLNIIRRFGLEPDATCGHSFGELTALCAAGWIDPETLFSMAIARGKFMAEAAAGSHSTRQAGAMLAVSAPLKEIEKLVDGLSSVVLANRNSQSQGVLSGPVDAIDAAEKKCIGLGFKTRRLPVSAAFHSPLVQGAQEPFRQALAPLNITPTRTPVYSNSSAEPFHPDAEAVKEQIAAQIALPVDFVTEIENLYQAGIRTFVEIGPKSVLTGLIRSILRDHDIHALSLDASAGKQSGLADLARTLCRLGAIGHPVSLNLWEKPAAETPRPRMPVSVLGANFKPQKQEKPLTALNRERFPQQHHITKRPEKNSVEKPMSVEQKPMDEEKQKDPVFLSSTFTVLQEGLKSIQALQARTAEAHQKFLETQAEAGRVLQQMMDSTRRLTEAALGIPAGADARPPRTRDENSGRDNRAVLTGASIKAEPLYRAPAIPAQNVHEPAKDRNADKEQSQEKQKIQETLLTVVSELTGYPVEMLGLEMDIEADLGIDSIKRVEILSTLEERLPALPPVSPELMGRLKTLSQIIAHVHAEETQAISELPAHPPQQAADRHQGEDPSDGPHKDQAEIREVLLAVVSELTGYPVEMLGLEMDIEADLGIDSIKRVEILSTLEERLPGLPPVSPELMGRLKTLSQIVAHFNNEVKTPESAAAALQAELSPSDGVASAPHDFPVIDASGVQKQVVKVVESTLVAHKKMTLAPDRCVYITEDSAGLAAAIHQNLENRDIPAVLMPLGQLPKRAVLAKAAGLIIVASPETDMTSQEITDAFFLAQAMAPDLMESARNGGAFFASITRLDGAFGFNAAGVTTPLQGSLAGLVKTAAMEWAGVLCRALDIDPQWHRNEDIAAAVAAELLAADASDTVEVGLGPLQRCRLQLSPESYSEKSKRAIDLAPGDVVVISGGARGITAAAAEALAHQVKPTLVLLGRTAFPVPEPEWLLTESSENAIKKAIIRHEFNGRIPSPVQVEAVFQKHMTNREIAGTLARLKSSGASVHYYAVDIRYREKLLKLFDDIRSSWGPIQAVVHGAGVLEDRLIIDKTRRQFSKVFSTKVQGLQNILEAVKGEPLKYLVLFSSVAARMGNKGQADYAMANEALNKIARQQSKACPDCRVVSINWGPWDGGMVSASLKREFKRKNIRLIPPESGVQCLLHEMAAGADSAVEVVIGAELNPPAHLHQPADADIQSKIPYLTPLSEGLALTLKREVDVENLPILTSHVLDGKPVVPFALMAEWFGQGALHENPGLSLLGIDDMRLMKGIRLDQQKRLIRLFAGKARKDNSVYEVDVELRDGVKDGVDVIHSRATAVLAESFSAPPLYTVPAPLSAKNYVRTREEVYEKILFHGDDLHGIREIVSCASQGMLARISTAPPPEKWMKEPFRSRWIADPLVMDCAFQMAIVWCFEEKGFASLPSYYARYRQYRKSFPVEDVTAVLEVSEASTHKMKGNFTFLDAEGVVIAQLHGYEAVMDGSLFKTFKPQLAANA